jgi:hypothetical protein
MLTSGHNYVHIDRPKINIVPLSRVLDHFENEFNSEDISYYMAKSRSMTGSESEIKKIQQAILYEWDQERIESLNRGNLIHSNMESMFKTGSVIDPDWHKLCSGVYNTLMSKSDGSDVRIEQEVWDKDYLIGGTCDRLVIPNTRTKCLYGNYYDIKTGKVIRTTGDKFLKAPLDFLVECEYTRYALQLSGYAYMGEKSFGIKPKSLVIEYIKGPYDKPSYITVPYMKYEVEIMFKAYRQHIIMTTDEENW